MAELSNYEVADERGNKTTMQLTAEDAQRLNAKKVGPAHDVQVGVDPDDQAAETKAAESASRATGTGAAMVQNRARKTV
jgi:hypothetical protein